MIDPKRNDEHAKDGEELKGVVTWPLLAALGVSYVISGEFSGWNLGVNVAGFRGFLVAMSLMALMYFSLVLLLCELSSFIPSAGGGYSYARRALGPLGGFATGLAIMIEYVVAPSAIVIFIGQYLDSLVGWNGAGVYALFYTIFVSIQLIGVGESMRIMFIVTALACLGIILTSSALLPYFQIDKLSDGGRILEVLDIWKALPFAMWPFLAVEGVPLASGEAKNPSRDIPRGSLAAMVYLTLSGFTVVIAVGGTAGETLTGLASAPLVDALILQFGESNWLPKTVNVIGLFGLIASFFSIIYGYSRLIFALSKAGYFPSFFSRLNSKQVPVWALILPGVVGFLLSLTGEGDKMVMVAVFGATISYMLISISFIVLRIKEPNTERPFRLPCGIFIAVVCLVLSILALTSCFKYDWVAGIIAFATYAFGMFLYLIFKYRHHGNDREHVEAIV